MNPRVLSVNLAVPHTFQLRGREIPTGIFKEPAAGRVVLKRLGLEGDVQADKRYHGGSEQAVYVYASEHAASFTAALGRTSPPPPGFFGENFTTEGLLETDVAVGDVYRVGNARVQVVKPRSPCFKLGLRVGSSSFVRTFLGGERIGFYLRVVEEGEVGAGDPIARLSRPDKPLLLPDLVRLLYFRPVDSAALVIALGSGGLCASVRGHLEDALADARSTLFG